MSVIKLVSNVEAEKLIKEKKDLVILDVRTFSEVKSGKIPNAINIPISEIEWELEALEQYKEKEIFVYCKAGVRSNMVCNYLEGEGFKKLYDLRGGILDYTGELV